MQSPRPRLREELTGFVGRRRELTEIRRRLPTHRLITLLGVGGVGKTRLARELARQVQRTFDDGVCLVELAPLRDAELLAETVLDALEVQDRSPRPRIDVLAEHLSSRRILIVLDNCEHVVAAVADLVAHLLRSSAGLKVLATSRTPLGVEGELLLSVPPLSLPAVTSADGDVAGSESLIEFDAVTLFAQRAAAAVPGFVITSANRAHVARLCKRLDGIPLAIELAAVRMRVLSVEQLLDRISDRFGILTGGSSQPVAHHRTLRATVEWSAQLCSAAEQLLWHRVTYFAGDFDLAAVEQVCSGDGLTPTEMLDLITGLADKSILSVSTTAETGRYAMLETLREFGRELRPCDDEVVQGRHRDWYLRLVRRMDAAWSTSAGTSGDRVDDMIQRLEQNYADVRVALEHALTTGADQHLGLEMTGSLWTFWSAKGLLSEGRYWLGEALRRDEVACPQRVKALWTCSYLITLQGDLASSGPLADQAQNLAMQLADVPGLTWATIEQGQVALLSGRVDAAVDLLTGALDRARSGADDCAAWTAMFLLAEARSAQGADDALGLAETVLAEARRHNWRWFEGYGLWVLAVVSYQHGDVPRAAALARGSLRVRQELADPVGTAWCVEMLAAVAASRGDHERAARLLGVAHASYRRIGVRETRLTYSALGQAQTEQSASAALGGARFRDAFDAGTRLDARSGVAEALVDPEPPAPPLGPGRVGETRTVAASAPRAATGLTSRQLEVAELIAEGLSNKEIAERLTISRRTAEAHVENILDRLGFSSRTQVGTWLARLHH